MRHYETIFLLKPTLTEEETKAKIEFFRTKITDNQGTIAGFDDMGIKQLAYEIQKNKRGYYYVIYFTSENYKIVDAIQTAYKFDEEVLKFMTIKFDKKTELKAWETLVANKPLPKIVKPEYKRDSRDSRDSREKRDYNKDRPSYDKSSSQTQTKSEQPSTEAK